MLSNTTYEVTLIVHPAPTFDTPLAKLIEIRANQISTYTLPIADMSLIRVSHQLLPSIFTQYSNGIYTFNPNRATHVGKFAVSGALESPYGRTKLEFTIIVTNKPPEFELKLPLAIQIENESQFLFTLPKILDPEGMAASVKSFEVGSTKLPSFVTFDPVTLDY